MDRWVPRLVVATLLLVTCGGSSDDPGMETPADDGSARADVGGYELAYTCVGEGSLTVLLEAGLGAAGQSEFLDLMPQIETLGVRVCAYDRAGIGSSDARPRGGGAPTAGTQAEELHRLLVGSSIEPPIVLVPHSYGGLVARVFADRYPDEVAGFVFEDVSTAWEIDLWPRWDDSPWVDGEQRIDIETTEGEVLDSDPLGVRPSIVVSQATYEGEGIPRWAAKIFARQQAKLAALGDDAIHVRADGSGHFIHDERPSVMIAAIAEVVDAVRTARTLRPCEEVFAGEAVTCFA